MRRIVPMTLMLAATLLAAELPGRQPAPGADGRLEGVWVIESVRRDGVPDPAQVGGTVTFAGRSVTFQPRVGGVAALKSPSTATQPNPAYS